MIEILLFWLLLALPGGLVVRRLHPALLDGGVLAVLPLAYLASFVMLAPLSIIGYVLHLPVTVLTVGVVVLIAVSVALVGRELIRRLADNVPLVPWPDHRDASEWFGLIAALVLVADLALTTLTGSHVGGDALFHIGRARMVLDHGLNSWDPIIGGQRYVAHYHTNLYHALIASCAQLTGRLPFEVWLGLFAWAKLLVASSSYHLAYLTFGTRAGAWIAAVLTAVFIGPNSVLPYPNTLAPLWLFPLGMGMLIELVAHRRWKRAALGLAAVSFIAGQLHALYLIFLGLFLVPTLAVLFVRWLWAKRPEVWGVLACVVPLSAGLPFLVHTLDPPASPPLATPAFEHPAPLMAPPAKSTQAVDREQAHVPKGFLRTARGNLMLDPSSYLNPRSVRPYLLLLMVFVLVTRRSPSMAVLLGVLGTSAACMYIPPLANLLVEQAGAPWIVRRMSIINSVYHYAILPALLFSLCGGLTATLWFRLVALVATLAYATSMGVDHKHWPRNAYLARAVNPPDLSLRLERLRGKHQVLAENVPAGATVWTEPGQSALLGALCNCSAFVTHEGVGARGVPRMWQRRLDAERLIDPKVPLKLRVALLRHYGIRHFFSTRRKVVKKIKRAWGPLITNMEKRNAGRVITVDYPAAPDAGP